MDVRNCKRCGKLFNYMGGQPICPKCLKSLDLKFEEVKEYVYDNPKAGIQEVADENDVTTSQIKNWIREEKLSFSDDSDIGLECEKCGTLIKTGRYCKRCKDTMADSLGKVYEKPVERETIKKKDTNAKMRFLDS